MSIINKGIFDLRTAFTRQTGNDWPTAQVITTTDVIENSSNLYFTNTRVVNAVTIGTIPGSIAVSGNLVANGLIIRNINVSDSILSGNIVTTSTTSNVIVADSITANIWNRLYTANVIETSGNLYFTNARVVSALIPGTAILIEANGRISANLSAIVVDTATNAAQVLSLSNFTTANLAESSANLYFTNTRVVSALIAGDYVSIEANGRISANVSAIVVQTAATAGQVSTLSNFTTANLAEGTNLYYTNARARTAFTAGKGISLFENGTIVNIGSSSTYNLDINGSAGGNILGTMSTFATFPTTPTTTRFVLRSLHVVNMSDTTSLISGNILYATGNTAVFANQIPIATGGLVEFIKNGQLLQPGDKINLQGFNSASTATSNILNAMYTYETFDNDATYIGLGQTLATSNTNITIYNSLNGYSIVESIILVNVSASTARVKLYWADANGTPKVFLAYNTPIPTNSSVELLTAAKRLDITDVLVASYDNAGAGAVSTFVSARTGPTYAIGAYTATTEIAGNISLTFSTSELDGTLIYYTIE